MSAPKPAPKWKRFEDLVAHIQATLAPGARVERNVTVTGRSGVERQIDIGVWVKSGQFELFIAIDCKDYNRKVNVNDLEAVIGSCQDVGANQGAIVTPRGFTSGAMKRAKAAAISLYTLIDAEEHEWQTLVTIPILLELRGIESLKFTFSSSADGDFRISQDAWERPLELTIYSPDGSSQGTLADLIRVQWKAGRIPSEPGEHADITVTTDDAWVRTGGQLYRINIRADVRVEKTLYVHQVPLAEIQGFKDELTGAIHTRGFTTERIDIEMVLKTWQRVESIESLAVQPIVRRTALDPDLPKT